MASGSLFIRRMGYHLPLHLQRCPVGRQSRLLHRHLPLCGPGDPVDPWSHLRRIRTGLGVLSQAEPDQIVGDKCKLKFELKKLSSYF